LVFYVICDEKDDLTLPTATWLENTKKIDFLQKCTAV